LDKGVGGSLPIWESPLSTIRSWDHISMGLGHDLRPSRRKGQFCEDEKGSVGIRQGYGTSGTGRTIAAAFRRGAVNQINDSETYGDSVLRGGGPVGDIAFRIRTTETAKRGAHGDYLQPLGVGGRKRKSSTLRELGGGKKKKRLTLRKQNLQQSHDWSYRLARHPQGSYKTHASEFGSLYIEKGVGGGQEINVKKDL